MFPTVTLNPDSWVWFSGCFPSFGGFVDGVGADSNVALLLMVVVLRW